MIPSLPMEFWIAVLFIINFVLVVSLFLIVRRMNGLRYSQQQDPEIETGSENIESLAHGSTSADKIMGLLEPLVVESRSVAVSFETQIKEKKRLIKELNEALDTRIISINLLLSRADAQQKKLEARQSEFSSRQPIPDDMISRATQQICPAPVEDQQHKILSLFSRNVDIDTIAQRLSIPRGEVQIVVDLKEKFVAMEKNST